MIYWMVDVFSKEIFSGNSSCVLINEKPIDELLYQKIAHEFFQSESIFIDMQSPQEGHFKIRSFSPYYENSMPGYSLFSAAHVLWFEKKVDLKKPLYFENNSQIYKLECKNDFMPDSLLLSPLKNARVMLNEKQGVGPMWMGGRGVFCLQPCPLRSRVAEALSSALSTSSSRACE